MARRPKSTAATTTVPTPPADPIDAALDLAATVGWAGVTMADIARDSGLPLGDLLARYPGKGAILDGFARRLDAHMIPGTAENDPADSPRDRLFAVMMRRFDALQQHRNGVRAIVADSARDPLAICGGLKALRRAAVWTLEAAGIDSAGWRGAVRQRAIAAIYAEVSRVWLKDSSADMAATMAALDRRLEWAENWAKRFIRPDTANAVSAAA